MKFTKEQAQNFDHELLDFTSPSHYHLNHDLDLILVNGYLYSTLGLYAEDTSKFDNCIQEY